MSDRSLLGHVGAAIRLLYERSPIKNPTSTRKQTRNLSSLPFDILLGIAELLHPEDVIALKATCRKLRDFTQSRALWLTQAAAMLDMCHPLPFQGFQRVKDISTPELARLVRQGSKLHDSWLKREPQLVKPYTTINAPEHEDIVWLSPITSKYTLCCTKGGRVLCWDLSKRECVAEWSSGSEWEIWKCRVEFDEGIVYFAMARRVPSGVGTDCQLMALEFPKEAPEQEADPPTFKALTQFFFPVYVISVYLLDPPRRIISAYLWLEGSNSLGLYVLLDWDNPQFVFINTGISCDPVQREWSCIGYDAENVVIHAEEETRGFQFFYPYSFLYSIATTTPPKSSRVPRIPPLREVVHDFLPMNNPYNNFATQSSHFVRQWWPMVPHPEGIRKSNCAVLLKAWTVPDPEGDPPTLGPDDPPPGTHLFTIAQHYISIPLRKEQLRWWFISKPVEIVCYPHALIAEPPQVLPAILTNGDNAGIQDPGVNHVELLDNQLANAFVEDVFADWGANTEANPTEGAGAEPVIPPPLAPTIAQGQHILVHPPQAPIEFIDDGVPIIPLVAVDFGLAVWLEYMNFRTNEIKVRYAVFPPVDVDRTSESFEAMFERYGDDIPIHTLETPPEIELHGVCHIALDQAQGTIILGMRHSQVYILKYR